MFKLNVEITLVLPVVLMKRLNIDDARVFMIDATIQYNIYNFLYHDSLFWA